MRSEDRILTTHTGSLPRPAAVEKIILAKEAGDAIDNAEFDATIQAGVEELIRQQLDAGVDVVNDGEASKASYMTYMTDRLSGFGVATGLRQNLQYFAGGSEELLERLEETVGDTFGAVRHPTACTGPITYVGQELVQRDIDNLKAAAAKAGAERLFMSAIAPGNVILYPNEHYKDDDEYLEAICDALSVEYEAIAGAGIVLQLDCPDFPGLWRMGVDGIRAEVQRRLEAMNHAVRNIPDDMVQIHVCWGNLQVPHRDDVPLKEFIDVLLRTAKPAGLSIEAANPRHGHEWKIFEDVKLPDGKYLIPGVLDVKTNIVEHPELIAQRIVQYANLVGRENVIAGTDCGFASIVSLHTVIAEVAWEKLRSMREGADIATAQLW